MKATRNIHDWFVSLFKVWRREFTLIFTDAGVMLFVFALPLLYPVVYSLIYNPEVVREIPMVVVDDSRTAESRDLVRMIDATEAISLYQYVPEMGEAKRLMNEHKCYGILHIPSDYAARLGSGQQAFTTFYCEMNLLLRYRTITAALADIQLELGSKIRTKTVNNLGLVAQGMNETPVDSEAVMLGDPTQGFASFIMPGIVILILQQSIILAVCMLMGGHKERLRRNGGIDPKWVNASPSTTLLGKLLCFMTLYLPISYYIIHLMMVMFAFPHIGGFWQYVSFIMPMLIASFFFGFCISQFVRDRESSMLVVVFSSVIFLFLSGLTWPRFAMNPFWNAVASFLPAAWGIDGFININSDGATLHEVSHQYTWLWILSAIYFTAGYIFLRLSHRGLPARS